MNSRMFVGSIILAQYSIAIVYCMWHIVSDPNYMGLYVLWLMSSWVIFKGVKDDADPDRY